MQNKKCDTLEAALERLTDDAIILVGGFGIAGVPEILIEGVCDRGLRGLTIVANNSGTHETGIARLLAEGCVGKIICSFPWAVESFVFKEMYEAGKVDLEVVPQGTLAERLRTAGAGLGGFLTPTAVGTELGAGKPVHVPKKVARSLVRDGAAISGEAREKRARARGRGARTFCA